MKELVTITRGEYNQLKGKEYSLVQLESKHNTLKSQYRDLEKRMYSILIGNPERAKELTELGNYESVIPD